MKGFVIFVTIDNGTKIRNLFVIVTLSIVTNVKMFPTQLEQKN